MGLAVTRMAAIPIADGTALASLILRVVVGSAFVLHGYPKLANYSKTIEGMKSAGVPPAATMLSAVIEFFGGIFLILGFLTPLAASSIALLMASTTFLQKTKFHKKFIGGYELDVTYLVGAVALALIGSGPFSMDALLSI